MKAEFELTEKNERYFLDWQVDLEQNCVHGTKLRWTCEDCEALQEREAWEKMKNFIPNANE